MSPLITTTVARLTRWLQSLSPRRPIGITALSRHLDRLLPPYNGVMTLPDGIRMQVDTRQGVERSLFYTGERHTVLTYALRRFVKPGAFCIDAGANIGFYTLKMALWAGAMGRVAAFEPNPALLERLRENLRLNNFNHVLVESDAVDQFPGETQFYISPDSVLSSLNALENAAGVMPVRVTTIDDFMQRQGWQRLDAIKIDIEGHDCHALLGAAETLKRCQPVVAFEYGDDLPGEIVDAARRLFADLHYALYRLERSGSWQPFDWRTFSSHRHSADIVALPEHQRSSKP